MAQKKHIVQLDLFCRVGGRDDQVTTMARPPKCQRVHLCQMHVLNLVLWTGLQRSINSWCLGHPQLIVNSRMEVTAKIESTLGSRTMS
jgi:hypothetical protein